MKALERRAEIIRILKSIRYETMGRLAICLGVTIRTIRSDIKALRVDHPLITKRGNGGGVMAVEKPPSQTCDSNRDQPAPNQSDAVVRSNNVLVGAFGQFAAGDQPGNIRGGTLGQSAVGIQPGNILGGAFGQYAAGVPPDNIRRGVFVQPGAAAQPDNNRPDVFGQSEELERFYTEYQWEMGFLNRPILGFAQNVRALIIQTNCGRKEFCEKTLLSERSFYRVMNDQFPYPTRATVMLICVGLALGGIVSERLLELAGFHLNFMLIGYKKALYELCGRTVYECDEIFVSMGLPSILPKPYRQCA